jgi:hypothetical protein
VNPSQAGPPLAGPSLAALPVSGREATARVAARGLTLAILLVVFALNFMDRQILAVLAEPIKRDLALSDTQLGLLYGLAFAVFYSTVGIPLAGRGSATAPASSPVGALFQPDDGAVARRRATGNSACTRRRRGSARRDQPAVAFDDRRPLSGRSPQHRDGDLRARSLPASCSASWWGLAWADLDGARAFLIAGVAGPWAAARIGAQGSGESTPGHRANLMRCPATRRLARLRLQRRRAICSWARRKRIAGMRRSVGCPRSSSGLIGMP